MFYHPRSEIVITQIERVVTNTGARPNLNLDRFSASLRKQVGRGNWLIWTHLVPIQRGRQDSIPEPWLSCHWLSLIASASKKSPSVPCISALKLRPCHVNINIIGQIYNFWNLALINCQKLFAADSLFLFGSFLLCVLIWWSQFLITFCDFNAL